MRTKFVIGACWAAAMTAVAAFGADTHALLGATREQILAQFGEPKSHIEAGNREVLIFAAERVVLRDNRVIEIDDLPTEPPPAPAPTPANASNPTDAAPGASGAQQPATAPTDSGTTAPNNAATSGDTVSGNVTAAAGTVAPAPPQLIIKSVRPPSRSASAVAAEPPVSSPPQTMPASSASASPSPADAASAPAVAPASTSAGPPVAPSSPSAQAEQTSAATTEAPQRPAAVDTTAPPPASATPAADSVKPPAESEASASAAATPIASGSTKPKPAPATTAPGESAASAKAAPTGRHVPFTAIAIAAILGGIGYLYWRRRQRAALLAATAVSRSPFATPTDATAAPVSSARFTSDLLEKLEWKRFEELVASYYNKTGVVATRTKSGPASAVQIRISWKGEQRPFACVQCHAHPPALIDARPVQALVDALAAEDIRRGYVVTSGKFGVPARDVAEEKHITLLSGELFLEKLNALPEPARAELLRDATTGDYTTPTCPTCESKMSRSLGESVWTCSQCGTTLARG